MKSKTLLKLLIKILLIIAFLFPLNSYADYGIPETIYDAVISNPNGTKLIDDNGDVIIKIPYKTEVVINSEYILNGKKYFCTYYDGKRGYISSKDINPLNIEMNQNETTQYIVFREGAEIYSGPGLNFDVISEIPEKTILDVSQVNSEFGWGYTTYNGISGWIPTHPYDVYTWNEYNEENMLLVPKTYIAQGGICENISIITLNDVIAVDFESISKTIEVISEITIPKDTVLEPKYYFNFEKSLYYVIDIDNKEYVIKEHLEENLFSTINVDEEKWDPQKYIEIGLMMVVAFAVLAVIGLLLNNKKINGDR